jgi:hypothetical protein
MMGDQALGGDVVLVESVPAIASLKELPPIVTRTP